MDTTDIQQAGTQAATKARSFLSDQLDSRSTQIGESINSTAGDLRRIADELRANETIPGTANLATQGADAIERIGSYLQSSDADRLIADAEDFARRQPWAVAAAALAAGFAASRVLKASSVRRYRESYGG